MTNTLKINNFIEKHGQNLSKEAIEELRNISEANKNYEEAFINSPCTIGILDSDLTYIDVNNKVLELFGKKREDFIGKKLGHLLNSDLVSAIKSMGEKEKVSHVLEFPVNDDKKSIWITITKSGSNYLAMGTDVTDYKLLEEEKNHSDKMAFLGEVASFIIHEINNPLMTIGMASEIIQLQGDNPVVMQSTQQIEAMVETINKIIQSLKVFSRKGDEISEVSVCDLFEKSKMILG